ncbi:MAG TPA: peptidylprolyl isomerase [Rudaea sp.]|jgi:peptidyl-prolyl cis-trans isomerase C
MQSCKWIPLILLLAGCSSASNGPDTRPLQADIDGPIAETVNGTPVPQALLESVARARNLDLAKREQREQALALLTDYVLLAQAAQQNGFQAEAQFRADVEAARLQGLANATLAQMQQQAPITDAVVRAEFDAQVARAGKLEYDFTQLLFDNADDALKAESEIVSGKAFADVYKAWRAKARQAKSFTRVRADQVPEELAKTLSELKNGETTKVPVKTRFGWHVVHLDIVNPFTPPPFEQVKDSVRQTLLRRVGQERLHQLKDQAKIEYPPGVSPPTPKGEDEKSTPDDAEKAIDATSKKD